MSSEYLDAMEDDFSKVLDGIKKDLSTIRTGRASPQLLDGVQVKVSAYGASMPLNQLASVSVPEARMLIVNPWDKGTLGDIEKAIMVSGLGLNPSSDGQIIRVPIPALTGERRKDLVRSVGKMTEDARIRARGVRKEYNDLFKQEENDKEITEDEMHRFLEKVQDATNKTIKQVESIAADKEKEVQEV